MPSTFKPDSDSSDSPVPAPGQGESGVAAVLEFGRLKESVAQLSGPGAAGADLKVLAERVLAECVQVKSRLVGVALPLPQDLHALQALAVETLLATAKACGRAAKEGKSGLLRGFLRDDDVVSRGLMLLAEAYETSCLAGCSPPYGFWLLAHELFGVVCPASRSAGERTKGGGGIVAYKRLLAISTMQPEGFTSAELQFVYRLLDEAACLGEISASAGESIQSSFWIDYAQDAPPVPTVRREPPPVEGLGFYSARLLGRHLTMLLDELDKPPSEAPESAWDVGLDAARLSLYRRLRERWAMPPTREQPRRRSQYSVQVCIGLPPIWRRLNDGKSAGRVAEWTVLNESPGGYAIMRLSGVTDTLVSGMAIALRKDGGQPWSICVIRWVRAESPDQVELGLQLISNSAIPVRVAFRTGAAGAGPVRALVLPPLETVRRHQAILAPAGTYTSRRFVLVHEGTRLYVAQGRLLSLDMQTTSVELFQFEVDPYPI